MLAINKHKDIKKALTDNS